MTTTPTTVPATDEEIAALEDVHLVAPHMDGSAGVWLTSDEAARIAAARNALPGLLARLADAEARAAAAEGQNEALDRERLAMVRERDEAREDAANAGRAAIALGPCLGRLTQWAEAQAERIAALERERDTARSVALGMLAWWNGTRAERDDARARLTRALDLLARARPEHFEGECHGACMDGEPGKCATLALVGEIDALMAECGRTAPKADEPGPWESEPGMADARYLNGRQVAEVSEEGWSVRIGMRRASGPETGAAGRAKADEALAGLGVKS